MTDVAGLLTGTVDVTGLLWQWGPHRPTGPHGGAGMPWGGAGGGHWAGGGWIGLLLALLVALAVVALLVGAVALLVGARDGGARAESTADAGSRDALGVLRRRYAAGEVDDDEFDRRRARLDRPGS
jgi:putative membrane protein